MKRSIPVDVRDRLRAVAASLAKPRPGIRMTAGQKRAASSRERDVGEETRPFDVVAFRAWLQRVWGEKESDIEAAVAGDTRHAEGMASAYARVAHELDRRQAT
jgi:hypothetical protein